MRTTLTIDSDVAAKVKEAARKTGLPFKTLINNALRVGLETALSPQAGVPYQTKGHPLGLRAGLNYDNVSELLELGEGDNWR